jgi:predicted nucleic acid-binding protein
MIGLDCNILVQIALPEHPAHAKTINLIQSEARQEQSLVFPSLIVTEFLRVLTDKRRFSPPFR